MFGGFVFRFLIFLSNAMFQATNKMHRNEDVNKKHYIPDDSSTMKPFTQ